MNSAFWPILLIALGLLTSCATPKVQPLPSDQVNQFGLLSFIRNGSTKRDEVLQKLGTPSGKFEAQRILTYQIRINDKDGVQVFQPRRSDLHPALTHWEPDLYSLVLIFGSNGVLEKHSLVGANKS